MVEIIKGREIPKRSERVSSKSFRFDEMEVGDSFILDSSVERKKFSVMLCSVGKRLTKTRGVETKFSTRSENGEVWVQRIS